MQNSKDMPCWKLEEINISVNNARTAFGKEQMNEISKESKQKAFNRAQLLKQKNPNSKSSPATTPAPTGIPAIPNANETEHRCGRDHVCAENGLMMTNYEYYICK